MAEVENLKITVMRFTLLSPFSGVDYIFLCRSPHTLALLTLITLGTVSFSTIGMVLSFGSSYRNEG